MPRKPSATKPHTEKKTALSIPSGSDNQIAERAAQEVTKRKRNRPDLQNFGYENAEPGDNARYLRHARIAMNLPPIDVADPVQVERRINEYFDYCEQNDKKPSMIGMSNWIGVDISTFDNWQRGKYRETTHLPIVKKAAGVLKEMWADYMQNGKINPVSGIFLGKIQFGFRDQQEVIVTPNNPIGDPASQQALEDKYLEVVDDA